MRLCTVGEAASGSGVSGLCGHRAQVLDGSPWVQSKAVYVLAASTREAPDGMTFTLRTRVARPRLESELTKARGGQSMHSLHQCRCLETAKHDQVVRNHVCSREGMEGRASVQPCYVFASRHAGMLHSVHFLGRCSAPLRGRCWDARGQTGTAC